MATTTQSITLPSKEIRFDRQAREYHCYFDGQYVGSYGLKERQEAENYLNELAYQEAYHAGALAAIRGQA